MDLIIRKASENDLGELQKLYRQVDALHHHALPQLFKAPDQCQRTSEFIREMLTREDTSFLVAELASRVIGFAAAVIVQIDHPLMIPLKLVHISDIVVDEHFYGKGVAQRLVDQVNSWAQQHHARQIQLTVFEFNQRAIAFYQKVGFTTGNRRMWREVIRSPEEQHDSI
jgi:ribosomal protein S18 acetylase RimI-like enzyme